MNEKMSWMLHPAVKKMDPRKLAIVETFVGNVQGKSAMAAMPILMQTQRTMQEQGLTFTAEESALLTEILTQDMTPAEKAKVEQMRQLVQKYQSGK